VRLPFYSVCLSNSSPKAAVVKERREVKVIPGDELSVEIGKEAEEKSELSQAHRWPLSC
jgi:hypothetical protein